MTQLSIANYASRKATLNRLNTSIATCVTNSRYGQDNVTHEQLLKRKNFCIFLKLLVDKLTKTDPSMRRQVKLLVRECTRKSREGDLKFLDLTEAIEVRVRYLVGEQTWRQATVQTKRFLIANEMKGAGPAPITIKPL
jgi:hypothetical protein